MSARGKFWLRTALGAALCLAVNLAPWLGVVQTASAQPVWVDGLRITVRRGPSVEYRIRDFLPSGSMVEILGAKEGWTRVRLAGGGTGWVLSRYLTDEKPLAARLEASQILAARLKKQLEMAGEENSELRRQVDEVEQQQAEIEERLDLERQSRLEEYRRALEIADNLIGRQKRRNTDLAGQQGLGGDLIVWFLTGASAAALGLMLGGLSARVTGRRKRKPGLM